MHPYLGIQMATLTPEMAQDNNNDPNAAFYVPEVNGVLVVRVLPNTPAARAGMRRGDVITQVEGQGVTSADQLQAFVENSRVGQNLQLKVQRGRMVQQFTVRTAQLQDAA
jgi:S1-C subfamily serine protease